MSKSPLFLAAILMLALPAPAADQQDHVRFAWDYVVESGEEAGDVVCFACSIRVRGTMSGDAVAFGGEIEITGTMSGDAVALGGGIHVQPGAVMSGDVVAFGGPVVRSPQAQVSGDVETSPWFLWFYIPGQRHIYWRGVIALGFFHLALALILFGVARRRRIEAMASVLTVRPIVVFLGGVLVLGVFSLLSWAAANYLHRGMTATLCAITAVLGIAFVFGYVGVGNWLGRRLAPDAAPLAVTLAGMAILFILELIPILGMCAFALFSVEAFGITMLSRFGSSGEPATGAAPLPAK